jgi:hypothetical protein
MRHWNRLGARGAWLVFTLALQLLGGCDVAVAGYLASRSSKHSSSSGGVVAPDMTYKIWVGDLGPAAVDLDNEQTALNLANGNPSSPLWTLVEAAGTASTEIDLSTVVLPGSVDTVLVQCPKIQAYKLDGIERLDVGDIVPETVSTSGRRSNFFDLAANADGVPDGVTSTSNVTVPTDDNAWLFCRFSASLMRFRVNIWTPAAGPVRGDVVYSTQYMRAANQIAGGAAVNSSDQLHMAFREGVTFGLLRLDPNGTRTDVNGNEFEPVDISAASVGSASVAIDAANAVIVAVTRTAAADTGNIRVRKYTADLAAPLWGAAGRDFNTTGVDRVEWNGLAVLTGGDVMLAGSADFGAVQGVGHFMRRLASSNGNDLWSISPPPPPADVGTSYWMAVATSGTKTIASTGDLTSGVTLLPYTRRTTDNSQDTPTPGAIVEDWSEPRADSLASGKGQAVGIDTAGNVYTGGYYTRGPTGRDMVLLRYPLTGPPASVPLTSLLPGDDEILDLAVDSDDSVYVVGYESVTSPAQGKNIILLHISAAGALLMKRTVHGGLGDDRAVSVVLSSDGMKDFVYVVGEITVAGAETDILVRKYVR